MKLLDFIEGFFVILILLALGWLGNDLYRAYSDKVNYEGLRFVSDNHTDALKTTEKYDPNGDWIAVNVKGMSYERGIEVCQHEMAHEIFAEIIENHPDKIKDVMEIVK